MNRIKELRKQRNLSLNQLSSELKKAGKYLSADSLSKYERGVRGPKIETLERLARYYEVTVDYLRGKSNTKHGTSVVDTATSDAALPDDLPVIPEAVGVSIKEQKSKQSLGGALFDTVFAANNLGRKKVGPVVNWVVDNDETYANAWLLGVWRVEETG